MLYKTLSVTAAKVVFVKGFYLSNFHVAKSSLLLEYQGKVVSRSCGSNTVNGTILPGRAVGFHNREGAMRLKVALASNVVGWDKVVNEQYETELAHDDKASGFEPGNIQKQKNAGRLTIKLFYIKTWP